MTVPMPRKHRKLTKSSSQSKKLLNRQGLGFRHRKLVPGFERLPVIEVDSARLLEAGR
jgi:hypothetical protein